jgi:deazaflavin-dependent oxidoreductase (nitroreductase family)
VNPGSHYEYERAGPLRRMVRRTAGSPLMIGIYLRIQMPVDRFVYRVTRGRSTLSSALSGLPVAMLTTTGARTGVARTQPVMAMPDGEALVVIASNYGQPNTPSWCHNLRAHPRATVKLGGATRAVAARELGEPERERWYERGIELYPPFEQYRRRTPRRIPVIRLEPR